MIPVFNDDAEYINTDWLTDDSFIGFCSEKVEREKDAQQNQKDGYWIDDNENKLDAQYGRHLYRCSECGKYANEFVGGIEDWWDIKEPKYCPNCGVKMKVGDADADD